MGVPEMSKAGEGWVTISLVFGGTKVNMQGQAFFHNRKTEDKHLFLIELQR
jgi:hypothetical protein